ncbi:Nif3-like dinuclear metal center hexameric protein [Propionicicella superfundia]|uniref:Nif3-like dinuclear metal center hexameric protein n=1 Tax=Propionicicella superfundia TaxID=348582 RepID=UPI00041C5F40|nr:Nif3-like dinuclear metal center hexameric protein [Propionicicella superfundia]
MAGLTVADVCAALDRRYPPTLAEQWDRNGLYCGDPAASVTGVLFAVDPTDAVIAEAVAAGCELIVTHHPLLLRGIHSVTSATPKGRRLLAMVRAGISAFNVHTPADSAAPGVSDAVADLLGLTGVRPLDAHVAEPRDKLVTFVPADHVDAVVDALAAAGAGTIGAYDRCYFAVAGSGGFRASADAQPFTGAPGQITEVAETRLELVLPRRRREDVTAALRSVHPYETPAFDLLPLADAGVGTGIGRIGTLPAPLPARDLAARLAASLPATVAGLRLGGDPERVVSRVAILAGAGDSHLDAARAAGADAYVTSDLRHHPAEEALAWDDAPVLVDVPHWACEWAWLPHAAAAVREDLSGHDLTLHVSTLRTEPWSLHVNGGRS